MKVAITTGGGDCPGLNCVIRAVVLRGLREFGWEMYGILDGLEGLIHGNGVIPLREADVRDIHNQGGTILGTTNRGNPFRYPVTVDGKTTEEDISDRMVQKAAELGIDAVVFVGGDGTQEIAARLAAKGLRVVGVPKTIDNDLLATDYTFGFDTAVETVVQALDRLRTTGRSHDRTMILEVMGRHAGWIALHSGLAGGADVILLPEIPYDIAAVAEHLRRRQKSGVSYNIIVISEGARPVDGAVSYVEAAGTGTVARLGGAGEHFAAALALEGSFETRVTVLGHIQRGGTPSSTDRVLATRFGVAAAGLIARGEFSRMVCLRGDAIDSVPIEQVAGTQKTVEVDGEIVNAARALGVCLGDRTSL